RVDGRVIAEHEADKRGWIENVLQGGGILVNPKEQQPRLLREKGPHAVQTPARLVGMHHQRVRQQGAEDLEFVLPMTRQLMEQRIGLRFTQLQTLKKAEHETDFVEGETDDIDQIGNGNDNLQAELTAAQDTGKLAILVVRTAI